MKNVLKRGYSKIILNKSCSYDKCGS
jgi:hypothetical protein